MKETMKEVGYEHIGMNEYGQHILMNHNVPIDNPYRQELWYSNKNHASYGLIYKNTHLEFCSSIKQPI